MCSCSTKSCLKFIPVPGNCVWCMSIEIGKCQGHFFLIVLDAQIVSCAFSSWCLKPSTWQASGLFEHSQTRWTMDHALANARWSSANELEKLKFASTLHGALLEVFYFLELNACMCKQCVPGVLVLRPSPQTSGYEAKQLL